MAGRQRPMSATIALRGATMADAQALFDVHRDAVQTQCAGAYSEAQLRAWFEGRRPDMYRPAIEAGHIWLAECNSRVLGFVGFDPGEVTLLFVRHEAARVGLGKRLFAFGLEQAQAGFDGPLTVVATRNSQPFYAAHGFAAVETLTFLRGQPALHIEVVKMQCPARATVPTDRTRLETAT
jgi:GNAT superfamily N-acetyltransferase